MLNAVPRQTLASTADQMAMSGSESQATGDEAHQAEHAVEEAVARLVEHQLPDDARSTTPGTIQEARMTMRRKVTPRRPRFAPRCSAIATSRPSTSWRITLATTKMNVFCRIVGRSRIAGHVGVALQRVFVVGIEQRRVGEAEANDVDGGKEVGDEEQEGERQQPQDRPLGQPPAPVARRGAGDHARGKRRLRS